MQQVVLKSKIWRITWLKWPMSKRTQSSNSSTCPEITTPPNMIKTTKRRSPSRVTSSLKITKISLKIFRWIFCKPIKDACQLSKLSNGMLTASTSLSRLLSSTTTELTANYPNNSLLMMVSCMIISTIMMYPYFILVTLFCSTKGRRTGISSWCMTYLPNRKMSLKVIKLLSL